MTITKILNKAIEGDFLCIEEGLMLWENAPLALLMAAAYKRRCMLHPETKVSWIIDRNVNYTNICQSACSFCNFWRSKNHPEACTTQMDDYHAKIRELYALGGRQLLLQGGLHPDLRLGFYTDLFRNLKHHYPDLKLHALGPPEIAHISKLEGINYTECLIALREAGLDSLPGAGAEILVDRVRQKLSPNKCSVDEWLDVMRAAHQLNITSSATMMLGHIETVEERFEHLAAIREVQAQKPENAKGFLSFIPWPYQGEGTILSKREKNLKPLSGSDYIRMIALSRLFLPNIPNIQASWLTVGKAIGQICLHAGANDFGSIMIEENVVSVAGADHKFDAAGIQQAIKEAGFIPIQRNQEFETVNHL